MVDYYSFEDVMEELELSEEEIKRMVSEGELRAFRDENKMKFKKEDVESIKKERITEPTVILPQEEDKKKPPIPAETSIDLEMPKVKDKSPGAQITPVTSRTDTFPTDTLKLGDTTGLELGASDTFIEEIDTSLETAPITKLGEGIDTTGMVTETVSVPPPLTFMPPAMPVAPEQPKIKAKLTKVKKSPDVITVPPAVEAEIERRRAHPIWTIIIFLAFITCFLIFPFFFDLMRQETGRADVPMKLTGDNALWHLKEHFYNDPEWTAKIKKKYPDPILPQMEYIKDRYSEPAFFKPDEALPRTIVGPERPPTPPPENK